jgi:hypothetical protein
MGTKGISPMISLTVPIVNPVSACPTRPTPPPARRRAAADAEKDRGRAPYRGTRRDAASQPAGRIDRGLLTPSRSPLPS